jgi:hypothetical protein
MAEPQFDSAMLITVSLEVEILVLSNVIRGVLDIGASLAQESPRIQLKAGIDVEAAFAELEGAVCQAVFL